MESARGECGEKISLRLCRLLFLLPAPFSFMSDSKHRIFLAPIDECFELLGVKNVQQEQLNATQEKAKRKATHFVLLYERFASFFLFYSSALFMTNNVALYENIFHRSFHPLPLSGLGVSSSEISLSSPLCLALPSRDPKNCITNHFCVLS